MTLELSPGKVIKFTPPSSRKYSPSVSETVTECVGVRDSHGWIIIIILCGWQMLLVVDDKIRRGHE